MFLFIKNQFRQILSGGFDIFFFKFAKLIKLILANLLALLFLPLSIFIQLLSKYILIRFSELPTNRIGHFALETDLYLTKKKIGKKKYIDLFCVQYLDNFICNKKLYDYFKKKVTILPSLFIYPLILNAIYYKVFSSQFFKLNRIAGDREVDNIICKTNPNLILSDSDKKIGEQFLFKISNLGPKIKFVILIVRDSEYLDKKFKKDWSYHNYRDGNVDDYILACEELTKHGYYVFRMGHIVKNKIKTNNPMIIDYATNGMRTELLDIYLADKCDFCISNSTGYDALPIILRKPILFINYTPVALLATFSDKNLITIRHHYSKRFNRRLSLKEIFDQDISLLLKTSDFLNKEIVLEDNSPEEIRDATIDMKEFIAQTNIKDCKLNKIFWNIYSMLS